MDKSITYSQRIFAAYVESGHFLVDHYMAKKKQKCPNTLSTIPQLIMNCLCWIMYHITASQIQACGKDKIAQYVLLPSSLPFSFAGHFLHFTSVEKVFFAKPWGWWNYFEGSTGVGTGETSFHWNFLIIIITPACLTEKWQNWTTTDTLAGTTLTVYSNICHNYYRVMLSLPSTSSFWSLTFNTLGNKKNLTLYFIKLK